MTAEAPSIGIITALPREFAAMRELLGEPWEEVKAGQGAGRRFTRGIVPACGGGHHSVVLAMLSDMGNNLAAIVATRLLSWYPSVRHLIIVGIAGGIPHPTRVSEHVRLGDIVISDRYGVVQYDLIKDGGLYLEHRAAPRPPSPELVEAVRYMQADEAMGQRPWLEQIEKLDAKGLQRPDEATDVLASTEDPAVQVPHPVDPDRRPMEPRLFYGPIASANVLLKNAVRRDALRERFGVRAVEMEGSGIADASWSGAVGYLVVRGVCDYCDGNKSDLWQPYAAAVAAAYVCALLESMPAEPSGKVQPNAHVDAGQGFPSVPPNPNSEDTRRSGQSDAVSGTPPNAAQGRNLSPDEMMTDEQVRAAIERIIAGTYRGADLELLRKAESSGRLTWPSGARAVNVGGNAGSSSIVTGDRNFVVTFNLTSPEELARTFARFYSHSPSAEPHPASAVRVLVHRALFVQSGQDCFFVNVTNLSPDQDVEITHVWFESVEQVHVVQPSRPLPRRLKPNESWETWLDASRLPASLGEAVYARARVRLSDGAVVASTKNIDVPPLGFVPGWQHSEVERDRISAFWKTRTEQVLARSQHDAAEELESGPVLLVLVVPEILFAHSDVFSIADFVIDERVRTPVGNRLWFPPLRSGGGSVEPAEASASGVRIFEEARISYSMVHYQNAIESGARVRDHPFARELFWGDWAEQAIVNLAQRWLSQLREMGVQSPWIIDIALVGVLGLTMSATDDHSARPPALPFNTDVFVLPECRINGSDLTESSIASSLHLPFRRAWNASGRRESPNYRDGQWAPRHSLL